MACSASRIVVRLSASLKIVRKINISIIPFSVAKHILVHHSVQRRRFIRAKCANLHGMWWDPPGVHDYDPRVRYAS